MIRIAGKTHDAEKAYKLFADMEADGYIETAKTYNSIISALGSTKRYSEKAIEYFHKMQLKGIVPDEHTYVAVLRATAKVGDTQTAYDALQDMKIHGHKMTEYLYNGLIRTYAGAAALRNVKEEHIDLYIKDSFELFNQLQNDPDCNVTPQVLNSLLLLHCNAMRVDDLDSKVLILYDKHKIPYDIYTY